jgi:hypothetical protein
MARKPITKAETCLGPLLVDKSHSTQKLSPIGRKLAIEYRSVSNLRPDPRNPRLHDESQVQQIARSIEAFGFNVPILINEESQVVAGHGRLLASKLLGLTEVRTIRLEHLTSVQAQGFMIADNRLTENAEWDDRMLGEQLKILSEAEIDFSLEVTGFAMGEIDLIIENVAPATAGRNDRADAIPDSGAEPQVTQAGNCWILGRHRAYCGDARNDSAFSVLMQGRTAEMVFTAPHHNDASDGNATGFGKIHHPDSPTASRETSAPDSIDFLKNVVTHLARHSADGALQYICMDWRHSAELLAAAMAVYTEFKNLCVWVQDSAAQGSLYRSQHELVFVFKVGKKPLRNNNKRRECGRYRTNVWNYRRVKSLPRRADEGNLSDLQPTVRPVELVADAILDCTARGEIGLDPFLESGTTMIAAERTGRACYGIEMNPRSVDTIVRRWQVFTGHSAVEESTGKTFSETEKERYGRAK